jgi:integrase
MEGVAMSRVAGPYRTYRRKDTKKWVIILYPASGLPPEMILQWKRKSFSLLPSELAIYREPKSKGVADTAAAALIEYLKHQTVPPPLAISSTPHGKRYKAEGELLLSYLRDFWKPDSPYAQRKAKVEGETLSSEYIHNNARDIERHIAPYPPFEGLTLGDLTAGMIDDWMLWAADRGLSGRRINAVVQVMRVPVRRAIKRQELGTNPFATVEAAPERLKERGILSPVELSALVRSPAKNAYDRLAFLLAVMCGMRLGEVRGLLWGDIGDGVIRICHNWQDREGLKTPKQGSARIVPMPSLVADALSCVYEQTGRPDMTHFVFERKARTNTIKPMGKTFFRNLFVRELKVIGIEAKWRGKDMPENYIDERATRNLTYHGLRHTFITLCRLAGISDLEIQALAGHKSARTMARYSHAHQVIDYSTTRMKLNSIASFAASTPPANDAGAAQ